MAIIISKDGKDAQKVMQSRFELEDAMQEYVKNNPDTIPLYDISDDIHLLIAAREFPTQSGPIDALGFDNKGNIYVVETKLFKNPDKRTVVAQALDYGASLWRHSTDFEEFEKALDAFSIKYFQKPFREKYAEFFELEDASESIGMIKANLDEGSIKFVVLMDQLHDRLKDLVVFVNQNSKFDLYAVELEYYKHESFEIVIPKLFGAEVKKDVPTTTIASASARRQWNEATFLEAAREQNEDPSNIIRLYEASKSMSDRIRWGTGATNGTANFVFDHINKRSVYTLYSSGDIGLNYGWLNTDEEGGTEQTDRRRDALRRALEEKNFHTTTGKSDFWHSLKYDSWNERVDELVSLLRETLTS